MNQEEVSQFYQTQFHPNLNPEKKNYRNLEEVDIARPYRITKEDFEGITETEIPEYGEDIPEEEEFDFGQLINPRTNVESILREIPEKPLPRQEDAITRILRQLDEEQEKSYRSGTTDINRDIIRESTRPKILPESAVESSELLQQVNPRRPKIKKFPQSEEEIYVELPPEEISEREYPEEEQEIRITGLSGRLKKGKGYDSIVKIQDLKQEIELCHLKDQLDKCYRGRQSELQDRPVIISRVDNQPLSESRPTIPSESLQPLPRYQRQAKPPPPVLTPEQLQQQQASQALNLALEKIKKGVKLRPASERVLKPIAEPGVSIISEEANPDIPEAPPLSSGSGYKRRKYYRM